MQRDYEAAEYDPLTGFQDCCCGSKDCRGTLRGFQTSGNIIIQKYGDYYADYLKSINNS